MSQAVRDTLIASPLTIFRHDSQRNDLRDPAVTKTGLIALLGVAVFQHKTPLEFTAVKSDHHDDSGLGTHSHFNGDAADVWPLKSAKEGDYMEPTSPAFAVWLSLVAASPWCYQIGLAGSANTSQNMMACNGKSFVDGGADHVHLGAMID